MRYIKNYNLFRQTKKDYLKEEWGVKYPDTKQVTKEVPKEEVKMSYSWSQGSSEEKVQVVKDKIESSEGFTLDDILTGLEIASDIFAFSATLKSLMNKTGQPPTDPVSTYITLTGTTDPDPVATNAPALIAGGLPKGGRFYTATVGDLIAAMDSGVESDIFKNFKPTDRPKEAKSRIVSAWGNGDYPDFLAVNGEILNQRLVFDLKDKNQVIVASGNGLIALSRMVRAAWKNKKPGEKYNTAIIEEGKIPAHEGGGGVGEKLVFGNSKATLETSLQIIGEFLTVGAWDKKSYIDFMKRTFTFRTASGQTYFIEPEKKTKMWLTKNGGDSGVPLTGQELDDFFGNYTLAGRLSFGKSTKLENMGNREEVRKQIKLKFILMHVECIPSSLYGNKYENLPGYWDMISEKLDFQKLSDSEIDAFIDAIRANMPVDGKTEYKETSQEYIKIFDQILAKYEANYGKMADHVLDEITSEDAKTFINKVVKKGGLSTKAQEKMGSLSQISTVTQGDPIKRDKLNVDVDQQIHTKGR